MSTNNNQREQTQKTKEQFIPLANDGVNSASPEG